VADPPPHLAARRREQRAWRRRRRIGAEATPAALVAAAAVWLLVLGGLAGHATTHRVLLAGTSLPALRRTRAPSSTLAATMAAGDAEIHRLVALGLPVYCGGPRGNEVAFTFDDGPGVYTHLALNKLRRTHERATFFDVGKSMNAFPGYLPRELRVAAVGDHTYTHPDLAFLAPGEVTMQLERAAQMIKTQSGQPVDLWRPPYEATSASVVRIAQRLGLLEILWSVDSRDSLGANWSQIIKLVEARLRPGAIVEMHENRGQTIRALTTLLPYLHRHRLRSVSLPELLAADPPSLAQLRRGLSGCGERVAARTRGGLRGD
jgi:peptidoglycan/xylan/chitin deacetylase (PgdA/CDA1 family)